MLIRYFPIRRCSNMVKKFSFIPVEIKILCMFSRHILSLSDFWRNIDLNHIFFIVVFTWVALGLIIVFYLHVFIFHKEQLYLIRSDSIIITYFSSTFFFSYAHAHTHTPKLVILMRAAVTSIPSTWQEAMNKINY